MALSLPTLDGARSVADIVRLLGSWRSALQALTFPALQGQMVRTTLASGTTVVEHGLRAAPSGWLVLRSVGAAGAAIAEVSSDARTITFASTATVAVDLWVWP